VYNSSRITNLSQPVLILIICVVQKKSKNKPTHQQLILKKRNNLPTLVSTAHLDVDFGPLEWGCWPELNLACTVENSFC
jgi:hypothetical protein